MCGAISNLILSWCYQLSGTMSWWAHVDCETMGRWGWLKEDVFPWDTPPTSTSGMQHICALITEIPLADDLIGLGFPERLACDSPQILRLLKAGICISPIHRNTTDL